MFIIPNLTGGGAERALVNIYEGLRNYKNYELFIVLLQNLKNYEISDENLIIIDTPGSKNLLLKLKNFIKRLYSLYSIKKRIKPDICISFLESADALNLLTKQRNQKIILSIRSYMSKLFKEDYSKSIFKYLLRIIYSSTYKVLVNRADLIICVSRAVADDFRSFYNVDNNKIKVIYNPIQIDVIEELKQEPLNEYETIFEQPVLITSGRLTKAKGHWYLIRAFKLLKEKSQKLKLVILGKGELKDYLIELSENLGLKTFVWDRNIFSNNYDVYFLGFQKNPFKFISKAKVFVFTSLWEGFPNALVEAMACNVPVISTDCKSGPREILAPTTNYSYQTNKPEFSEYGILLPVFNSIFKYADEPYIDEEKVFADILYSLLENEKLRQSYAHKAKERVEDFRIETIIKEWRETL